jgi:DNA-binding LytR/AlgR family response regulator
MKIFTVYIIDDEPLAIRSLKKKLENFPEVKIIGESTKASHAIKEINSNPPDILFLDIQLDEGTGFDLLNNLNFSGKVIFVTAFDEFAFRAFEVNALDYLLKPIALERLEVALAKAKSRITEFSGDQFEPLCYKYSDRIMIMDKNQIRFVLLESILVISAARDYSTIEDMDGKKFLILRSMSEWEERLPPEHFIRIHRSFIVNINHVEKILRYSTSSAKVYLKNHPDPVTLSRTFYKNLKTKYL